MTTCAVADVHYPADGGAHAALLIADGPDFATVTERRTIWLDQVADYRPGRFFERELPALRAVIGNLAPLDLLIIDGYVDLDLTGRPGLGAHAHQAGLAAVVVGIAKTPFRTATHAIPVLRGIATKPVWVTAAGMDLAEAAALVTRMAGTARVPDAARDVDRLTRNTR